MTTIYERLDKEWADEWLADLWSGNFDQTTGTLTEPGDSSHCCLGVLCEQAVRKGVLQRVDWYVQSDGTFATLYGPAGEAVPAEGLDRAALLTTGWDSEVLPPRFRELVGLTTSDESTLTGLNDENDYAFGDIADYIKEGEVK